MYSSCNLGTFEFCAKLLPGCSSQVFLLNAVNFLLFKVAFFYGKSNDHSVILDYFLQKENQLRYFNSFD